MCPVKAVLNHGAADPMEIQGAGMKTTVLMPFKLEVIPTVDLIAGRIIAGPLEDLIVLGLTKAIFELHVFVRKFDPLCSSAIPT